MFFTVLVPFAVIFYARLVAPLQLKRKWRVVFGILCVLVTAIAAFAIPASLTLARNRAQLEAYHVETWLPWLYIVMVFIALLVGFIVIRDIAWWIARLATSIEKRRKSRRETSNQEATKSDETSNQVATKSDEAAAMSRREFLVRLSTGATVGCAAIATPPAFYHAKRTRIVKHIDIALSAFPKELDGLRIVHLSDIHVGNTIFEEDIAEIVAETNALKPDLIAITGDMADGYPDIIGAWLTPMRNFQARLGTWFVTGNHDHMWDGRGWCDVIRNLGIHVLDNAHEILDIDGIEIAIAGAIDARGDRKIRAWKSDPHKALENLPKSMFKLMLVHQPKSVDASFDAGANLVLLGHTHGGQCWPLNYLIDAMHKYARGLYRVDENAAFVSCGTGYWGPPLRIGIPCEIDVLTLRHG